MIFTIYSKENKGNKEITGVAFLLDGVRHCTYDIRSQKMYGHENGYVLITSSRTICNGTMDDWETVCKDIGCEVLEKDLESEDGSGDVKSYGYTFVNIVL